MGIAGPKTLRKAANRGLKRTPNVCRKEVVKFLYRVTRDACRLTDSCVEHENIQSIAGDGAHLFCRQRSAVGNSEIRRDCICAST
jgi:hypothetical protein